MTTKAPPSAALLSQSLVNPSSDLSTAATAKSESELPPPSPSTKERVFGTDGSLRRQISFWVSGMLVATAVRMACFSPLVLGNYLAKNLGPVERESVGWSWIIAARGIDLAFGIWVWKHVDGQTRKDGVLFGAMLAGVSRISLYAFEHAYFLLSTETSSTILLLDIVSLATAFSLLPYFLPHSLPARPGLTAFQRVSQNPALIANVLFACGLATTTGALVSYVVEHVGGVELVKSSVWDVEVPSFLAGDTLSPSEMMAHPIVSTPSLRSFLRPGPMGIHLAHSVLESFFLIPLASILPGLSNLSLGTIVFFLILPSSVLLLWDVLPISLGGAAAVGATLATRAGVMMTVIAWVMEELRMNVFVDEATGVIVDEQGEVVGEIETAVLVVEKPEVERSRL